MKKLILTVLAVLGFAISVSAQQTNSKSVKTTEKQKIIAKDNGNVVKKTKEEVVLKKDGTPDKRYKQKKKVVLKKDGTPDKRFK